MPQATTLHPDKSTTVRMARSGDGARGALVRLGFGALGAVAPPLVSELAERLFFAAPPRRRASARHAAALAGAQPFTVRLGTERIAAWSWGEGPTVLLVHGWAGRAAQLASIAPALALAGHRVVAFDAPGHGASSGRRASLLDMADAIHAVVARTGPLAGLYAHSLGAAASAVALGQGLGAPRAVFVGPPVDPVGYFLRFLDRVGVPEGMRAEVMADLERRNHFRWADLDLRAIGPRTRTSLLVLHDELDDHVPWTEGAAIADAWPGSRLVRTRGLGHHAILRDPEVAALAVDFLAGREVGPRALAAAVAVTCATRGCDRPIVRAERGASNLCEQCALEVELYHRASRWP